MHSLAQMTTPVGGWDHGVQNLPIANELWFKWHHQVEGEIVGFKLSQSPMTSLAQMAQPGGGCDRGGFRVSPLPMSSLIWHHQVEGEIVGFKLSPIASELFSSNGTTRWRVQSWGSDFRVSTLPMSYLAQMAPPDSLNACEITKKNKKSEFHNQQPIHTHNFIAPT